MGKRAPSITPGTARASSYTASQIDTADIQALFTQGAQDFASIYGDAINKSESTFADTINMIESRNNPMISNYTKGIINELNASLGIKGDGSKIASKIESLPDYQFRLNQGQQALERTQAAKGGLVSGNALIEAQQFGQGLAAQAYGDHIDRLTSLFGIAAPLQTSTYNNQSNLLAGLNTQLGNNQLTSGALLASSAQSANDKGAETLFQGRRANQDAINQAAATNAGLATSASIVNANNVTQARMARAKMQNDNNSQGLGFGVSLLGGLL